MTQPVLRVLHRHQSPDGAGRRLLIFNRADLVNALGAMSVVTPKKPAVQTDYLIKPLPEPLNGSELNCILPRPPATVRLVLASIYLSWSSLGVLA